MPKSKSKPTKVTNKEEKSDLQKNIDKYLPYLQEVQKKLTQIAIVFIAFGVLGFINYQKILKAIIGLFNLEGVNIVLTSPYQFLSLAINTALATGFLFAFPLLLYHLISFLRPALQEKEYRLIIRLLPSSIILFIVGFAFGVWIVQFVISLYTKTTLEFSIGNLWDISGFLSQIILTGFLLAMIFQLPIIMTALMRFKIVKRQVFVSQRRYFYAALLIIGALLPPTDIVSLILLTIPPLFLFELALLLNHSSDEESLAKPAPNKVN